MTTIVACDKFVLADNLIWNKHDYGIITKGTKIHLVSDKQAIMWTGSRFLDKAVYETIWHSVKPAFLTGDPVQLEIAPGLAGLIDEATLYIYTNSKLYRFKQTDGVFKKMGVNFSSTDVTVMGTGSGMFIAMAKIMELDVNAPKKDLMKKLKVIMERLSLHEFRTSSTFDIIFTNQVKALKV